MDGLDWGALFVGIGGVLTGVGLWIRARAHIDEQAAEAERCRQQWEQDTIDRERQQVAELVAQREAVLNGHIATLTDTMTKQRARLDFFETEVTTLRAERSRDQEQIIKLTERVHKLEMENAVLLSQREARDEQIELLKGNLAQAQEQTTALFRMTSEISLFVRTYAGRMVEDDAKAA